MASSSASTDNRNYDVFLSFRGEDTRRTIVSYLYKALSIKGIFTFKDDQRLQLGDNISDQLIQAIQTSRFAVVVLSENYATSKWCLEELRLIMELHNENRIQVVPIFYGVEPTDVRHQTGSFAPAFHEHEQLGVEPERISNWRRALYQVGHLRGFDSSTCLDEETMVSDTVQKISSQVLVMRQSNWSSFVGMEAHMVKMHFLLNMESDENDVVMIGIWGMGGVGKTTIAKCLYDRLSRHFPAHYFIDDIKKVYKDKSPSDLQKGFLSTILPGQHIGFLNDEAGFQEIKARLGHQKVLLVLDGVDKVEHVRALARDRSCFGSGSRIIITTRDKGLLNYCGVNNVHEVKCLDDMDALQVFRNLAFGGRPPPSDVFEQLFVRASHLAHGLPSAIVAYALYLSEDNTTESWDDKLGMLETRTHQNVEEILRYSYDGLDNLDKIAFLQIACVLNRYPFNHVTDLLDGGRPRMNHLTAKSLISISIDGCVNMHFLVMQTGRAIVRQEFRNMPARQQFLWDHTEIYDVLCNDIGGDETEGLTLSMCEMTDHLVLSGRVFNVMHSIKFLKFFQHSRDVQSNVQLEQDSFSLPRNCRLLHWDAYPLQTMRWGQSYRFYILVHLNLQYSNLERLWDGNVKFLELRRLDVTGSNNLKELPDFSTAEHLEELIIDGCMRLQKTSNESLRWLPILTKLNAIHCSIFRGIEFSVELNDRHGTGSSLPTILMFPDDEIWFDFLTDLSIEGQIFIDLLGLKGKAEHLSFGSNQRILDQLMAEETVTPRLVSHPNSSRSLEITRFSYVEYDNPFHCDNFRTFPCLTELKLINLNIQDIPENISDLQFLETLDLSGNDFKHLPTAMGQLAKLKYLSLGNCRKLMGLPQLAQVQTLILSDCVNFESLPSGDTNCLLELWIDNCNNIQSLSQQLRRLSKLAYLDLSRNEFESVPESIRELSSLETLFLNNCKKLKSVEDIPESLKRLYAHGCYSLERVSLSPNHSIINLDLNHCPHLKHHPLVELSQERSRQCACLPGTGTSRQWSLQPVIRSNL